MKEKENGEIMLEGMLITVLTTFLLIWILAVGFAHYQRYIMTITTNDAVAKIAATYNNPDSDIIMGYISAEKISDRDLYRGFSNNSLVQVNQSKAEAYITHMLKKTNFAGTVEDVNVELKMFRDSPVRKHIEITTTCTFNTPFGEALELFGMDKQMTYEAVGRSDCTDIIDYISTVDCASYHLTDLTKKSSLVKLINSLIEIFNHDYA